MPLQRKSPPGNRNLASSINCLKGKGWYCHLSRHEQKILNNPNLVIAKESIPDDLLHGISRSDMTNLSKSSYTDIQNTSMFWDGSINSMEFQNRIQFFSYVHSSEHEKNKGVQLTLNATPEIVTNKELSEVPTIEHLQQYVHEYMIHLKIPVDDFKSTDSWNSQFHENMLQLDNLKEEYTPWVLPKCYGVNKSCGHVLQVDLQHAATNKLHLTTFENLYNDNALHSSIYVAAMFIQTLSLGIL